MSAPIGSPEFTEEFRARLRAWLDENASSIENGLTGELAKAAQATFHAAGFSALTWPVEYGGQGLTAAEQHVWDEEVRNFALPLTPYLISLAIVAPTLLELGTHEQKLKYLPGLATGEIIGCQLFSEPSAGSDIASLRTKAVRDGDDWVITGQKVWTTFAHVADFGILLARTNPDVPKHRGISMFLVDMKAPGVQVRPLRDMTGASKFNEVFFDEARMPASALVGEVDQGWANTVAMLRHERIAITRKVRPDDDPTSVARIVAEANARGLTTDPHVLRTLGDLFAAERAGELFAARVIEDVRAGRDPGPRGSVGKLAGALHAIRLADAVGEIFGAGATAWPGDDAAAAAVASVPLGVPMQRIAGGTDQIQRNIIGERILGLPKEPS